MAAPTGTGSFTSVIAEGRSITVKFSSISGATSYDIAYRPSSTSTATIVNVGSSRTYTITGLSLGTTYVVNYRAVNSDGDGPFMSTGYTITTQKGQMWLYNGSSWKPVRCYVYNGGWQHCAPHMYIGGWKGG